MEILLSDMKPGESGVVKRIEGGYGLERRFASLGLRIGKPITKMTSGALRGPVVVKIDEARIAIGRGMARKVFVEVKGE